MIKKNFIEVFMEKNCRACEEVLAVIASFRFNTAVDVSIFDRERDARVFQERNVLICPATFVNHKLVFYGNFSLSELNDRLRRLTTTSLYQ